MSPRSATKSPARKARASAASSALVATAYAPGWGEVAERLHPDDLAEVVAQLKAAVTDCLREAFAELQGALVDANQEAPVGLLPAAEETAGARTGRDPNELLKLKDVLVARPALNDAWLYQNAAACNAVRKGGKRSALLFTLAGVDAELERRRLMPIGDDVAEQPTKPTMGSRATRGPRSKRRRDPERVAAAP